MYRCKSGRHVWFNKEDADKCCDPNYVRILNVQTVNGKTYFSRSWMLKEEVS